MTVGQHKRAVFHYAAYHLGIRSEIALPELPAASRGDDFEIRLAAQDGLVERRSIEWEEGPVAEARFLYPGLARFVVRAGRELIVTPDPRGDPSIFSLYIQGMMLAAALHQRGSFVLHASVVELDGRAIAFLGPVGAGKSTLASAFRAMGHKILADDNAALDLSGSEPRVLPAFPSLKVYPAVARSLGFDPASLRPMHASQVKQAQPVSDSFSSATLRLDRIYVLDRQAEGPPARIGAADSVTELIRHSVPTRWGVAGGARHLRMCARMAGMAPLFRARTFRELCEIRAVAAEIHRHAAGTSENFRGLCGSAA